MALQTQQLERVFKYNSVDLIDPGPQYTAEQVRDFYSPTYPEILNAGIEGPEEKDGKLVYTFRRAVGTKGSGRSTIKVGYRTVPQLVALAHLDSDPVSVFAIGTDWSDATGAIAVIKGGNLARELVELLERQGLITPGKPVAPEPLEAPGELAGELSPDETTLVSDLHPQASAGVVLIAAERKRQAEEEGWDAEHDDGHDNGGLALAAACYASLAAVHAQHRTPPEVYAGAEPPFRWPWERKWWKPKDPLRDLVRAGALIAAEIDRLTRLQKKGTANG